MTIYSLQRKIREAQQRLLTWPDDDSATDVGAALTICQVGPILLDRGILTWPSASKEGDAILNCDRSVLVGWEVVGASMLTTKRRESEWLFAYEKPAAALGMALARRAADNQVWLVVTDRTLAAAEWWTALDLAVAWHLVNLKLLIVTTGVSVDGPTRSVPLRKRLTAFGVSVVEADPARPKSVIDGLAMVQKKDGVSALWLPSTYGVGVPVFEELGQQLLQSARTSTA